MENKKIVVILLATSIIIAGAILLGKGAKPQTLQTPNQSNSQSTSKETDSDKDGVPDVAEKTLGTDPNNADTDGDGVNDLQDKDPVIAENPIKNDATLAGFQITEALVENNLDPVTKKATDDHLELTIKNTSGKDLNNFEFYYTVTDPAANKKEGYYKKLVGFILKSGDTKTIHFDSNKGEGHFSENSNSIYRTTNAAKAFNLTLSTAGYKVETVQINKDAGGAEKAD